jgi:hypothetical protein
LNWNSLAKRLSTALGEGWVVTFFVVDCITAGSRGELAVAFVFVLVGFAAVVFGVLAGAVLATVVAALDFVVVADFVALLALLAAGTATIVFAADDVAAGFTVLTVTPGTDTLDLTKLGESIPTSGMPIVLP